MEYIMHECSNHIQHEGELKSKGCKCMLRTSALCYPAWGVLTGLYSTSLQFYHMQGNIIGEGNIMIFP